MCINLPPCRHLLGKLFQGGSLQSEASGIIAATSGSGGPSQFSRRGLFANLKGNSLSTDHTRSIIGVTTTITSDYSNNSNHRDRQSHSWFIISPSVPVSPLSRSPTLDPLQPPSWLSSPIYAEEEKGRLVAGVHYHPWTTTPTRMGEEQMRRPHTAHVSQKVDVDIDRLELVVREAFKSKKWFDTRRARPAVMSWLR